MQCNKDAVLVIDQIRKAGIGQAENRNKKEKTGWAFGAVTVGVVASASAGPQRDGCCCTFVNVPLIDLSRSGELSPR